jgi:hypothetical protein
MGPWLPGTDHHQLRHISLKRSSAVALAAALLLGGCSSAEEQEIAPLDVDALARNTSAFQSELLQDGVVDADEYERAVFAAHSCVTDEGFSPDSPAWSRGQLVFSVEMQAKTDAELTEMNRRYDTAYEDCMSEYATDVASVWTNQMLLSDEERDAVRPDVTDCLQAAGLDVDDNAPDAEIYAAMTLDTIDDWQTCAERYPEFFLVPPSGE